jgi:diguanylate cyclase (GGDEF)-like protein/PAS domain S-box-containing protein
VAAPSSTVDDQHERSREAITEARIEAAARRDAIADARDRAAVARDAAADLRDIAVARRTASYERASGGARRVIAAEVATRASGERGGDAREGAQCGGLAAEDRHGAAADRELAGADRLKALADREWFVHEPPLAAGPGAAQTRTRAAGPRDGAIRTGGYEGDDLLGLLVAEVRDYAILMLDRDGYVATWNAGARRFKGYRADEIIGRHFSVFYPAEDIAAGKPERELRIAAADGRLEDEGWRVRKDGTRFWANVVITALRDASGTLRGYGKITRDLTERRRADEALSSAEERFRRTFNDAPVGLAITAASADALGDVIDVNTALCELLGYDRERLLGMTLQSLTHANSVDRDVSAINGLLSREIDRYQGESRYIHATGAVIEVSLGVSLIRDNIGLPLHFITQIEDVSARKHYETQLQHMANHDPLTGLYNRKRFDEALDAQVARVRRYPATGALLMIDLDRFKEINDRLGHNAGDELLISVAQIVQSRVRETDVAARLGGDEFVVLMTEGGEAESQALAADLSDLIRRRSVVLEGDLPDGITASIGIAVFDDRENLRADDVLAEADAAMYTAKHDGRDRIAAHLTNDGVRNRQSARLTMHNQIAAALKHDRFELHLQPVLDLRTGTVGRHEALLRMIGDSGELIAPATFLHVAERFDQIYEIDRWVIEHAIALMPRLAPDGAIEINLSGRSLGEPHLATHISEIVTTTHVDPDRLIFEITETAAIENIHRAREFADELKNLGCHFALDDFGAGFGSFYYLKYLPFDYLKIDGEFVKNCTASRTDQLIIEACVQLARGLGKQTIAEFVEDADILRLVRDLGVDHAQGYEIARPQPADKVLAAAPTSAATRPAR